MPHSFPPGWLDLRSWGLAAAFLLVASGCASVPIHEVRVEPVSLPRAAVARSALRVGVHFTEAFLQARVEADMALMSERHIWRHDIGRAAAAMIRSALGEAYAEVVDVPRWPLPEWPDGIAAIVVPRLPVMRMAYDPQSLLRSFQNSLTLELEVHAAGADAARIRTVAGTVAAGLHGPLFVRQQHFDEALLRVTAGALIASLQREPLGVDRPAQETGSADPAAANERTLGAKTIALRIDAGMPQDDGIERRIAECLGTELGGLETDSGVATAAARLRDAAFPWFDPGLAPSDAAGVEALLRMSPVRAALRRLGADRLVLFSAQDAGRDKTDAFGCFGGLGAGACIGVLEERTAYVVQVAVWDAQAARSLGGGQYRFERKFGVVGLLLPIPYFGSNFAEACEAIRDTLKAVPRE